jgi:DTW domain-containing protein YfiP
LISKGSDVCGECLLSSRLCIFHFRPTIPLKTHVTFLIHHKEIRRKINSGRLAHQCLPYSNIELIGQTDAPFPWHELEDSRWWSLFLFPSDDALDLDEALNLNSGPRPIRLVVPDGNWGQARRMNRRRRQHSSIPAIKLPPGPPSSYRVRVNRGQVNGVSTFEAVARALSLIEGSHIESQMLPIFDLMVSRNLQLRGK